MPTTVTTQPFSRLLLIVIAIAGFVFGEEAAPGKSHRRTGLVGRQGAELIQIIIAKAGDPAKGATATAFGLIMVW
jgi:hypothetical protein